MNYREQYYRENNIYDIGRSFIFADDDTRYVTSLALQLSKPNPSATFPTPVFGRRRQRGTHNSRRATNELSRSRSNQDSYTTEATSSAWPNPGADRFVAAF